MEGPRKDEPVIDRDFVQRRIEVALEDQPTSFVYDNQRVNGPSRDQWHS